MKIYVLKEGLRYGPYSVEELRQQLDAGMFNPEHFASVDNCHTWMLISRISVIMPQLFTVDVDKKRNLLEIRYRGRICRSDVDQCPDQIRRALPTLGRGFRLLVDFSELEEMDMSCAPVVGEIMDLCDEAGVATVVRVIPNSRQATRVQDMSSFHYGKNVSIKTCASMGEAVEILFRANCARAPKITAAPN